MNNIKNINYEKKYLKYKIKYNNLRYTGGTIPSSTNPVKDETLKKIIDIYKAFIKPFGMTPIDTEIITDADNYDGMKNKFTKWFKRVVVDPQLETYNIKKIQLMIKKGKLEILKSIEQSNSTDRITITPKVPIKDNIFIDHMLDLINTYLYPLEKQDTINKYNDFKDELILKLKLKNDITPTYTNKITTDDNYDVMIHKFNSWYYSALFLSNLQEGQQMDLYSFWRNIYNSKDNLEYNSKQLLIEDNIFIKYMLTEINKSLKAIEKIQEAIDKKKSDDNESQEAIDKKKSDDNESLAAIEKQKSDDNESLAAIEKKKYDDIKQQRVQEHIQSQKILERRKNVDKQKRQAILTPKNEILQPILTPDPKNEILQPILTPDPEKESVLNIYKQFMSIHGIKPKDDNKILNTDDYNVMKTKFTTWFSKVKFQALSGETYDRVGAVRAIKDSYNKLQELINNTQGEITRNNIFIKHMLTEVEKLKTLLNSSSQKYIIENY